MLRLDAGRTLGFTRLVARKKEVGRKDEVVFILPSQC